MGRLTQEDTLEVSRRAAWLARILDESEPDTPRRKDLVQEASAALPWARSLIYAKLPEFQKRGIEALRRTVRADAGKRRSLTPYQEEQWIAYASSPDQFHRPLSDRIRDYREQCRLAGEPLNCHDSTLQRACKPVDAALGMTRRERRQNYRRQVRMKAEYANQVWQWDQHTCDFEVMDYDSGEAYRPILVAIVDRFEQLLMGFGYFKAYDTAAVQATLLDAFYPDEANGLPYCGVPEIIHGDNGKQFTSAWVKQTLTALGVTHSTGIPCEPQGHGFMENHHRWIISFEKKQPRYKGSDTTDKTKPLIERQVRQGEVAAEEPLTLEEANRRLRHFVAHDLQHRPYKKGPSRAARWVASIAEHPERAQVPDFTALSEAMKHRKIATLRGGLFQFSSMSWTGPDLGSLNTREVEVRYLPEDLTQVWVWLNGKCFCVARPVVEHGYLTDTSTAALRASKHEYARNDRDLRDAETRLQALAQMGDVAPEEAQQAIETLRRGRKIPRRKAATLRRTMEGLAADNVVVFPGAARQAATDPRHQVRDGRATVHPSDVDRFLQDSDLDADPRPAAAALRAEDYL